MSERTDRIPLAADVARCEPSGECFVRTNCARVKAAVPKFGSMTDFTIYALGGTALCPGYIDVRQMRKEAAVTPENPVRPGVKGLA